MGRAGNRLVRPERRRRSSLAHLQQKARRVLRRRRSRRSCAPLGHEAVLRRGVERAQHRPGPMHAALVEARSRDVNLDVAVSTEEGQADFWISSPDSGLSSFAAPDAELVPEGFSFDKTQVRCARLDTLIEEHARGMREIDFLKIDVEGAEGDVLRSFDPAEIRPTVILVEAISPIENRRNHEEWEPSLLDHGYVFAAFDGINRFYVTAERWSSSTRSHTRCRSSTGTSRSMQFASGSGNTRPSNSARATGSGERDALNQAAPARRNKQDARDRVRQLEATSATLATNLGKLEAKNAALTTHGDGAADQLKAMQATVSWRITRPLRSVRRVQLRWAGLDRRREAEAVEKSGVVRRRPAVRDLERAFARRLVQAANVLDPISPGAPEPTLDGALDALESALAVATVPERAQAWISIVAAEGSYPRERSVERVARRLRMEGPSAVRSELVSRFENALERGSATTAELDIRRDRVVVDVTHTVSNSLHTGIQRVVRETVSRWIDAGLPVDLVHFDFSAGSPLLLAQSEYERLTGWRDHLGRSGADMSSRVPEVASGNLLIPWHCRFVVPELAADPERCAAYRVLASSSVLRSLSLVGYDLIPMIAAYTVAARDARRLRRLPLDHEARRSDLRHQQDLGGRLQGVRGNGDVRGSSAAGGRPARARHRGHRGRPGDDRRGTEDTRRRQPACRPRRRLS